jgi:CheY-like chemotaxis protein
MDIQMPVMDGLEATRIIRQMNIPVAQTVPILAMTASAFQEDVNACLEAGMNGHLSKPVEERMLLMQIDHYLFLHGKAAETAVPVPDNPDLTPESFLPYLDLSAGLSGVRNNKKIYSSMLKNFLTTNAFSSLTQSVADNDRASTDKNLIQISRVSGTLSLKALYESLNAYTTSLKVDCYQPRYWEDLQEVFEKTQQTIQLYLNTLGKEMNHE